MLYKSDFYVYGDGLEGLRSELSVKIQGAMMKAIPTKYAGKLHIPGLHPYSMYALPYGSGYIIRVSALTDEAKIIIDSMSELKEITLYGIKSPLFITDVMPYDPVTAAEITNQYTGRQRCLEFVTPAMIKTNGRPSCLPDIPKYFYSVLCRLNEFEGMNLDYEKFKAAFESCRIIGYDLKTDSYNVTGNIFPGITGTYEVELPQNSAACALVSLITSYAEYCGVGAKTGMGMGGMVVTTGK